MKAGNIQIYSLEPDLFEKPFAFQSVKKSEKSDKKSSFIHQFWFSATGSPHPTPTAQEAVPVRQVVPFLLPAPRGMGIG